VIVKTRNHLGIALLAALLIFTAPAAGRADNLFRFYPEAELSGFYGDNVPMRSSNAVGDWVGSGAAGFYLDYTSDARYASLHYDTFAQLFAYQSRYDRAGEGQFVRATDDEKLSRTTRLRLEELFYRNSPTLVGIITSNETPQFNTEAAELLLANDQASISHFNAVLAHDWGRNWSSDFSVHQTSFFATSNSNTSNDTFDQSVSGVTQYHFSNSFTIGPGYRFYDFIFTSPGRPGEQAHWPFVRASWQPLQNLYLSGSVGVVISYSQGTDRQSVNPGGVGLLEYDIQRGHFKVYGGQEPELVSTLGGAGLIREVRGNILYDFTQRLTGNVGAGYYDLHGNGIDAQLVSWGMGLSDRVNRWLSVYAKFVELRRTESAPAQFLPTGTQSGRSETGNYFVVGLNVSVEAFRWNWNG